MLTLIRVNSRTYSMSEKHLEKHHGLRLNQPGNLIRQATLSSRNNCIRNEVYVSCHGNAVNVF